MIMPTFKAMMSRYLFNRDTPPDDLVDESLIRGCSEIGAPVLVDANDFMVNGGGRFMSVARFNMVRRFLSGDDYSPLQAGRSYTTSEIFSAYGIENKFGLEQYYYGLSDPDYMDRAFVFGSSEFKINDDAKFVVNADGTREIKNIQVVPVDDNFDFESTDGLAAKFNEYYGPQLDPSHIGRKVPIEFTGSVSLAYDLSSVDLAGC